MFSIGAADWDFDVKKYVDIFPGEDVLEGEYSDVGNSGATALASGRAALVLACMATAHKADGFKMSRGDRSQWMDNVIKKTFNSDSSNRKVRVEDVLRFDINNKIYMQTLLGKFMSHAV